MQMTPRNISRRELLRGSAAFALLASAPRLVRAASGQRAWAYVGTDGTPGNGKGISLFDMDPTTGDLSLVGLAATTPSPSWLTLDSAGRCLYAANDEGKSGSVTAYAVDRS